MAQGNEEDRRSSQRATRSLTDSYAAGPVYLQRLKYQVTEIIGPAVGASVELKIEEYGLTVDSLAATMRVELLAERIGGEQISRTQLVKKNFEAIDGPLQRWKHRHQRAWWLAWFVRWRPVRWINEHFERNVTLTVNVQDYATFPKSSYLPTPESFGSPVFKRVSSSDIRQERNW